MQSNSNTTVVGSATYTQVDTLVVSPTTCQITSSKLIHSDKDNSDTQVFELEFLGEYKGAGLQKAYRRLGQGITKTGEAFTVEPLKTLDNCEITVFKRDSDGTVFFSVKGRAKDFTAEAADAAARAKSIFG
jgi:hypothetical protein